ncbi:MAG: hypothetical protein LC643_06030 [Bacteroidales bacterium]|nr:hypothetical protein [Bacteroidales bacterium]
MPGCFIKLVVTSTIILFCTVSSRTADIQRDFKNISVEDGLPHYTINAIMQDYEGYIWVATDDGLARYDSHRYHLYKSLPTRSDSNVFARQALSLYEDSQKRLWVGTNNSLCLYNREHSTFLIGTDGGGLYVYNPQANTYSQHKVVENIPDRGKGLRITQIFVDSQGRVWVASLSHGFLQFDWTSKELHCMNNAVFQEQEIRAVMELNHNELLLGTYGGGIWRYNRQNKTFKKGQLAHSKYAPHLARIYTFHTMGNQVLIGTDGGGFLMYDINRERVLHFFHYGYDPYSIANNVVKSILVDKDNNIWLGHFKGGISFSGHRQPFFNIRHNPAMPNSLSSNMVSAIFKQADKVFIGTDGGGLNVLMSDGSVIHSLTSSHPLYGQVQSKSILALYGLRNGDILLGTYLDGVLRLNPESGRVDTLLNSFSTPARLNNDDIRCFFEDRSRRIWIGTNGGGVNIYNPADSSLVTLQRNQNDVEGSLSLDWIRSIMEDSYGYIWIGTVYGLNKYDPVNHTFMKFFHNPMDSTSLSNEFVYSVFEDSKCQIWVGTSHGLNKYVRAENRFVSYTTANGLPDDIIYGLNEDGEGNIWISTNNGISMYDQATDGFHNYDVTDGLLSNAFINGAMYRSADSTLYLGSIKGLTYFKPKEIKTEIVPSPLILTDFKLYNQSVPIGEVLNKKVILKKHIAYTDGLVLSNNENTLAFDFTLLSFSGSGKVKYAYKLEGFDKDWVTTSSNQNTAAYTDLPPGRYVFKVRTTNLKENQQRTMPVRIRPSFYQSVWFKMLSIILVVGFFYYWNRMRILKIESQKAILEKRFLEDRLQHEKEEARLKTQNLQYEMESKNAQLTSTTLLISHKNDIMREVKSKLEAFGSPSKTADVNDMLTQLVGSIDKEFKVEEDWQRFEEHFNHIHKDFFKKLNGSHYDLSPTYLKLCAYLKMNLTSKEIASLMNISVRGVEKARSRLRSKLEVPEGENLLTHISNL